LNNEQKLLHMKELLFNNLSVQSLILRPSLRLQLLDLFFQFRYLTRRAHPKDHPHDSEYETDYTECIHSIFFPFVFLIMY
jgi:hypothetical protein